MIVRIWRAEVDAAHAHKYREFARTRSLPMFRNQPGFRGAFFSAAGIARAVITLWDDAEAIAELETSEAYLETVAAIKASGFLRSEGTVDVFDVEDSHLEQKLAVDQL